MRYANIIEYAESLGLHARSYPHAREQINTHLRKLQEKHDCELHERGSSDRGAQWSLKGELSRFDPEAYKRIEKTTGRLRKTLYRKLMRRYDVCQVHEIRASNLMKHFGLWTLLEWDNYAEAYTNSLCQAVHDEVSSKYPFKQYARSRRGRIYGSVRVSGVDSNATGDNDPHFVRANYERGQVNITVTKRALTPSDLPCPRVLLKPDPAIILDCQKLKDGLWFMQWAGQRRGTQQLDVHRGAFCEGVLVPGYVNEKDVLENAETIHYQARVKAVSHALNNAA